MRTPDPGYRYTGGIARAAVLVGEPHRHVRDVRDDLVLELARHLPVDLYDLDDVYAVRDADVDPDRLQPHPWTDPERLHAHPHVSQNQLLELHAEVARHRACVHTNPSTSHGLSLLEVMQRGLPVVPLTGVETHCAVVAGSGALAADAEAMIAATRRLLTDPEAARQLGRYARRAALARHGLEHFLADWEDVLVHDAA